MKTPIKLGILFLLTLFAIIRCKKNNEAQGVPGSFKASGTILLRAYPFWPNINNDPPGYYTYNFDTVIRIDHVQGDTFRLYGLGINNMYTTDGPDCVINTYCGFFAIKQNDSLNFIPIQDPGGQAYGGARIVNDSLYFTYYHNFRNDLWTYTMAGRRL